MAWRSSFGSDRMPVDRPDAGITMLDERSASMSPIIHAGDQIAVAWVRRSRARRGAVVAYFDGRRVVAHRLLAWTRSGLLLKGDANRDADPAVDIERYCGEVVAVRRSDGAPLDLTSRRWRVAGWVLATASAIPASKTLRWVVTRALCHVAARWLR